MAIYRGPGGSGDAVGDASSEVLLALAAKDAAVAAQVAAETARDAAQLAETNAETAETNAETAETNAETAETNAETAATNAASSASAASTSATNASNSASSASTSATNASNSASAASTSATNASNSATAASTSASNSSTSASNAATSATNAANAQTAAETARDQTLTAYDNFDDRYLGAKTSDPSLDNDGNALVAGALYFNSSLGSMKVYTGSVWVDAYAAGSSFLAKANNLSDLTNTATARTNLGLAIGTDVQAYDADTTKNDLTNTFTDNQIISVTDTAAALRITQLGTGNALLVEDSTNPDSTPFVIDNSGNTVVGYTTTIPSVNYLGTATTPLFEVQGTSSSLSSAGLYNWSSSNISAGNVIFSKSLSGTSGTRGVVASGTDLGVITFAGDDGTNFVASASIVAEVDGTPGTNDMPGRLVFSTTADGASSPTERMRIGSAGQIGIGGANYGTSGQVLTSGGASAAPSWTTVSGSISVTGGDLTMSGNTGTAITNATLATVNSNTGSFGSATVVPVITVNGKGLITAVSTATISSLPSQTGNSGKYLTTDGSTASWGTISISPASVSDQTNSSTGYFDLPSGTTAQRPVSPNAGMVRHNTTSGYPEWYDATSASWVQFNSTAPYTIEYLVIAGGGSSCLQNGYAAGGGGAGGVLYSTASVVTGTSITTTIGAGGAFSSVGSAGNGANSTLTSGVTATAIGGGKGGDNNAVAQSGGSGGGGRGDTGSNGGGSGTSGQGNAGGDGVNGAGAGGGGGAGAVGTAGGSNGKGGNGGVGSSSYSTWASATSTGDSGYYAGGGGGGGWGGSADPSGGTGGTGGGGAGSAGAPNPSNGGDGTTNTGGGGGGVGRGTASNPSRGGNGGSGIIIIRYTGSQRGTGGTVVTTGGYTYHTFTSSGTYTA